MRFIFTSDLHGNMDQYRLLLRRTKELCINTVVIGGDIAPKGMFGTIQDQKRFVKDQLLPIFHSSGLDLLLTLGNDDFASLEPLLRDDVANVRHISMRSVLVDRMNFFGYPYVPITPFCRKDYEKWDNGSQPLARLKLDGVRTFGDDYVKFSFDPSDRSDTIEKDMQEVASMTDPGKTVYVIHTPPYGTSLDLKRHGHHVGSVAVRDFIERHRPLLTLHGHIHESVDISGKFIERIGSAVCVSSGNYNDRQGVAVIIVDTDDLGGIKREIVL